MLTLLFVILVISLLILVHEWGHFYSARKLGVRVEEFGFGFPPRILSRVKNGVRYSVNLFPLGGFVKIFGEHGEGEEDKASFISRPIWQRFIILAAGVFMNAALAWVLFSVGSALGVPRIAGEEATGIPVSVVGVLPGSPAERAGIKFGDKILEMRSPDLSLRVESEKDVRDFTLAYRGENITVAVSRGSEIHEIKVTPRAQVPEDEGPLGIALGRLVVKQVSWYLAPVEGVRMLAQSSILTLQGFFMILKELVFEGRTGVAVSGPVGIFSFAQDSRALGISFFLQFMGILSVNLAILNFLPIPALDGGRILFLVIEKLKGKRINPAVENVVHMIGFVLLILLMILVTYRDIARII